MMRRILGWALAAMVTLLAACGGGGGNPGTCNICGGSGTGSGTGTGANAAAQVRLALSAQTLPNQLPQPITVTVTAVNSANQTVSGAPVVVTADNGGVVTATASSTDSTGTLTATIGMGNDPTPRTINVTATSGSVTGTTSFAVVNSASGGSATMSVNLSSQTVTANSPATVTVTLQDAVGKLVPNAVVGFSTIAGLGTFSSSSALTDSNGQASVSLYPVNGTQSGADYVQATATVNGTQLSQTAGFKITATNVGVSSFTSDLGGGTLGAYGQANLTVNLSGTAPGTPVALSVVSLCSNSGKASITPATTTTTNGTATFTYKDAGCGATSSSDTVTMTVTGTATTATLAIPLASPTASSLGFVSANPSTIYLKGSGLTETSTVTFVVKDQAGNPLPNQSVTLTPTTLAGGLTMDGGSGSETKLSDSNGQVTVRINSGTVPTPVRVTATLAGANITTVSSNLSVAVGLPSELNFSLSQNTINIEGMNIDGVPNTYTIIASDRMGNPVPAGTTINFVTEGGQIQAQQFTTLTNGLASATANFQSAAPRPADGRITVLAYALGEESFLDANGNNVWDAGESFQDLGDVFLSRKFSATYNAAGADQYISLGTNGGVACAPITNALLNLNASIPSVGATTCDGTWGKAYVRRATETVLSTSASRLMWFRAGAGVVSNVSGANLDSGCVAQSIVTSDDGFSTSSGTYFRMASGSLYNMPGTGSLTFLVSDANDNRLNPMAAGTTVTASATTGITVSVGGGSPVPSTSSATAAAVGYQFSGTSSGTIFISTTSPKGTVTTFPVNVTTSATPPSGAACTQ